jgi:hypothetical protein
MAREDLHNLGFTDEEITFTSQQQQLQQKQQEQQQRTILK